MSTPKEWRPTDSLEDYFGHLDKRVGHQERSTSITTARDLLGPGFGPHATQLLDWNSTTGRFNGMWFTDNALNSPGPGAFLGWSVASVDGHTVQVAVSHDDDPGAAGVIWLRRVHGHLGQAPVFTPWEQVHPDPGRVPPGATVFIGTGAALPAGWAESAVVAPVGLRAIRKS